MGRFLFRLDPVLAHRARLEEEQHARFAAAMQRVSDAERLRNDDVARREVMHDRIRLEHATMPSDDLRAAYAHADYLDRAIVAQDGIIAEARRLADIQRIELLAKSKDRKVLETLRDRRRDSFELDAALREQRETDETNARRFDRAVIVRGIQ